MSSTLQITFRLATDEDAVPLEQLINAAFRGDRTMQVFLSTDHNSIDVTSVEKLRAKINHPDCAALLAVSEDGIILAHGSVRKINSSRAWFGMLAVHIEYQKRGLGSRVLAHAEEYASRTWDSTTMEFDVVNTRAELIAWYKKRGYKETGTIIPFPYQYHEGWQAVLRDDLTLVLFAKELEGQ
ncbi:hypothetical protein ACN47E_008001 [Coniothyrium glycines]